MPVESFGSHIHPLLPRLGLRLWIRGLVKVRLISEQVRPKYSDTVPLRRKTSLEEETHQFGSTPSLYNTVEISFTKYFKGRL
jgi:hypothetical protein